jgi:hypothetical protein
MHYRGIMDASDSEWYDEVLKACSSLDVNDFLHDVSPYVTNWPLLPYRAATTSGSQGAPSTSAPPVRLVESEIFHDSHERRRPQYPDVSSDEPLLVKAVGGSTNSGLWREHYLDPTFLVIPICQLFMVWTGLSVGRATRLPDTPDRPSRSPDKGQTGID